MLLCLLFKEKFELLNNRRVANFRYLDDFRGKSFTLEKRVHSLQIFVLLDLREYERAQVPIFKAVLLQGDHKSLCFRLSKHLHARELTLQVLGEGRDLIPIAMMQGEFQCSVLSLGVHDLIDSNYHGVVICESPKDDSLLRNCLLD